MDDTGDTSSETESTFQNSFPMEVLQADYKEEKMDVKYFSDKKTEIVIY